MVQIQFFISSSGLIQDRMNEAKRTVKLEKEKMELTLAVLRAHKDNMKNFNSQVSEFTDLLKSQGRTQGLKEALELLATTMDRFEMRDDFENRCEAVMEAFEQTLAEMSHLCDAE